MFAQVAELVDALVSGTSVRKDVQVRVLSRVQLLYNLKYCPGGEIGRHTTLRGWRRQKHTSSSLVLGTFKIAL